MSRSDHAQALAEGQQLISGEIRAFLARQRARLARVGAAWSARRKATRDLRQLDLCTDRELRDMGLSRSDFPAIIKGVYRRD